MPAPRAERIPNHFHAYRALRNGEPMPDYEFTFDPSTWTTSTWTVSTNAEPEPTPCGCSECRAERQQAERAANAEQHRCANCSYEPATHGYRDWITWAEHNGVWYCSDCFISCRNGCGNTAVPGAYDDRWGTCPNCPVRCWGCGNEIHNTDEAHDWSPNTSNRRTRRVDENRPRRDHQLYCVNCTFTCANCNSNAVGDQCHVSGIGSCCTNCARYCGNCGEYSLGRCNCLNDQVRGYGETVPTRWLGGPLKHDDAGNDIGYYVGFELEISARGDSHTGRISTRPIREWAEANLKHGDIFDCKHDGSVNGFEIATQPMTPRYFERVDWEGFMDVLNSAYPIRNGDDEPSGHGLHVHIGRVAFRKDPISQAAFAYLLGQGDNLERIARRAPFGYCPKVHKPVSASIAQSQPGTMQGRRIRSSGIGYGRDAINLTNSKTIEIRAFKSTRSANELRDAVRVVYLAAEYVRYLRSGGWHETAKAVHWSQFCEWVGTHYPEAFVSVSGVGTVDGSNKYAKVPRFWAPPATKKKNTTTSTTETKRKK